MEEVRTHRIGEEERVTRQFVSSNTIVRTHTRTHARTESHKKEGEIIISSLKFMQSCMTVILTIKDKRTIWTVLISQSDLCN